MPVRPTLAAAQSRGAESVTLFCRACARSVSLPIAEAVARWGGDATFADVVSRTRHAACHESITEAAPDWASIRRADGESGSRRPRPADWPD